MRSGPWARLSQSLVPSSGKESVGQLTSWQPGLLRSPRWPRWVQQKPKRNRSRLHAAPPRGRESYRRWRMTQKHERLLKGLGRSSSLIRGPCVRKLQTSARERESPPKALFFRCGALAHPSRTGNRRARSVQPVSPYEVYATILNRGETRQIIAVVFRGRLRQARQEFGVAICACLLVLEGVIERGEELEPSLDSGVVVPHFAYAFQSFVV